MQDGGELFPWFHSMQASKSSERCCTPTSVALFVQCKFGGVIVVLDVARSEFMEKIHQKVSRDQQNNQFSI